MDQPSHVCVFAGGGLVFVPQLPLETQILPLDTLSSVPTVTPEHLQPAGLGGAWEDKAAFRCWQLGGQSASAHGPASETWKSALLPPPPHSITTHVLFLS